MNILAIDPGTKCGWAIKVDGHVVSGVWDLSPRRHEGGGMRYLRVLRHLEEICETSAKPGMVVYEEVRRHAGTDAAHVYGGIIATIQAYCENRKIPYTGIPVGTIKKTATGKGNANKEAMLEAAARQWPGYQCADDNEADARWCLVAAENI